MMIKYFTMSWFESFYMFFTIFMTCQQFATSEYTYFLQDLENDFMMQNGFEENLKWVPNATINKPCGAFLNAYAEHSSVFTKCLVKNARPFRMCETCVEPYKKAITVFQDLVRIHSYY